MTNKEYTQLKNFIHKTLYETLTLKDYEKVIEAIGGDIRSHGYESWQISTICHNLYSEEAKSNLTFYTETRSFYCFSECCCSYNLITLVQQRFMVLNKEKTRIQCLKYICKLCGIPFDFKEKEVVRRNSFDWKSQLLKYTKNGKDLLYKKYPKQVVKYLGNILYKGWLDEGISESTMLKYHISWYEYKKQVTIPCFDKDNNLIGIRVRNTIKEIVDKGKKYMPFKLLDGTEYKFKTNNYLFGENYNLNEIKRTKILYLVESEKAVLKADTFFGDKSCVLGMYGSVLGDRQLKTIIECQVSTVYICLDSDFTDFDSSEYEKFEEKVFKIYNKIKPFVQNVYVIYNNCGFDDMYKANCFDFDKERFETLLGACEKIES